FGSDFRVYDKNKFNEHSKWLLNVITKDKISKKDFSAMNRLANSTKKNIILAYLDSENGISYFEISWKKL
ncbi:MAG: tRNA-intron lyase, partial [Candidatus Woesearchaeota archaeon]